MSHEPRLTTEVRRLLLTRRTAALATVDPDGRPYVSMAPFAVDRQAGRLVLLVSGLAAHTAHMRRIPDVSLLITDVEVAEVPVHALGRLTLGGKARLVERNTKEFEQLQTHYLARFPDAAGIAKLPDFRYVSVYIHDVRQVAGFGAARDISAQAFEQLLRSL